MSKVNPPPALRLPLSLAQNQEARVYFEQINKILFQLWTRTGGGNDDINDLLNDQSAIEGEVNEALGQIENISKVASINALTADFKGNQALAQIAELIQSQVAPIPQVVDPEQLQVAPVPQHHNSVITDYIDLRANAPHVTQSRRLAWNDADQTADLGLDYGVVQQIGQEVYARVSNTTGTTIPNGTVVGFAGATSNALLVAPYLADGSSPTLYILGVMTHDLPDSGEKGYCTTWGFVRGIDTSAFSAGDILYASPTVAGEFTSTKPTAPDNVIPLAACIVSDATDGVIFVRPTIEQMKYYGSFTKTTDQTPAAINTEYLLTFDNTEISNGVVIGGTTSQIIVPESGLYQFDATIQITSGSSSAKNVWLWFKKNGTSIANSARLVTTDINNGYIPIALNEVVSLAANDYVEIAFASDDTNITIDTVASTAFAPGAPAIALSVTQIQQ